MIDVEALFRSPNALAPHYRAFRVGERLLLTGHSHQAWPDCAREAQLEAFADAAEFVDRKWERAFEKADRVRRGFARLLEDGSGGYALGASTHDLLVRFLSALPLQRRPRIVTTDEEFHSLRRQLDRLAEERIEVVKVPSHPAETVGERLTAELDDRTAAAALSYVFFRSGRIAGGVEHLAAACLERGIELLIDAYHAINVVPFPVPRLGFERAFVVGGGYKYCQLGEGNCFLRVPAGCNLRPVVTGWFAEFDAIEEPRAGRRVPYGGGAGRFAGSTYDPTSHYRAAAVFDFFERQGLDPGLLRRVSQHQIALLSATFDALDLPETVARRDREAPLESLGGFLVVEAPRAGELCERLGKLGVSTDARGTSLRFGPAPYLCDDQLVAAMSALGCVRDPGGAH
ncbi:MAG TPA: kynureninase [Polyangia bacterium]|nr:kynureninase [Polyangia bacterium]